GELGAGLDLDGVTEGLELGQGVDRGLRLDDVEVTVLQGLVVAGRVEEAERDLVGRRRGAPVVGVGLEGDRLTRGPAVLHELVAAARRGDLRRGDLTGAGEPA